MPENKIGKLIPSLYNKKNYIVSYRALKFYMSQGLVLKKVHSGVHYNQSAWLREYIDFNTDKRALATNDFDKDFYKLMNNSIYGKTMENLRGRIDFELVNNAVRAQKLQNKPTFQRTVEFNSELYG